MRFDCACRGKDSQCPTCAGFGVYRVEIQICRRCSLPLKVTHYGQNGDDGWGVDPIVACLDPERCGDKVGGEIIWGKE